MSHLNYFEPYASKGSHHEDQLTRAFLVVLRHSQSALILFYDIVRTNYEEIALRQNQCSDMPQLSSLSWDEVIIETQKSSFDAFLSEKTLSVLLTNEKILPITDVQSVSRRARYDGIIKIGSAITFVIENKPRSYNVWQQQLNPNIEEKKDETHIIGVASIVEWKTIIKSLVQLSLSLSVTGAERTILSDFIEFISKHFGYLNPWGTLEQCKGNRELIIKRIAAILQDIVVKKDDICYGWGKCSMITSLSSVKYAFVGLQDEANLSIKLSYYFGDTKKQAVDFYSQIKDFSVFERLITDEWTCIPNFHLSYMSTNLIWFSTPIGNTKRYLEYWRDNTKAIYQRNHNDIKDFLSTLHTQQLINIDNAQVESIEKEIYKTKREPINVCPGFALHFYIPFSNAAELDKKHLLGNEILSKFKQPLNLLDFETTFLKNQKL